MKKNQPLILAFCFLLAATRLIAQSQSEESTTSPLMMFGRGGLKSTGEEKKEDRLPASANTDSRNRTAGKDKSSVVPRGTIFLMQNDQGEKSDSAALAAAQQIEHDWIEQKEIAIKEADKSNNKLNPVEKVKAAREAKNFLKNKADTILEAAAKEDVVTATQLTKIAQSYWLAAEEAELVEQIWTLRHKNKNITEIMLLNPILTTCR